MFKINCSGTGKLKKTQFALRPKPLSLATSNNTRGNHSDHNVNYVVKIYKRRQKIIHVILMCVDSLISLRDERKRMIQYTHYKSIT